MEDREATGGACEMCKWDAGRLYEGGGDTFNSGRMVVQCDAEAGTEEDDAPRP